VVYENTLTLLRLLPILTDFIICNVPYERMLIIMLILRLYNSLYNRTYSSDIIDSVVYQGIVHVIIDFTKIFYLYWLCTPIVD